jgi:hypothetical protein
MTPYFGIGGRIINDNNVFCILHQLILSLLARFNGPQLKNNSYWLWKFHNFKVALYLSMGLSSKSTSLRTIPPIKVGLIGKKKLCSVNNMVVMDHHGVFHLSKPQIPMIIPWCQHLVTIKHPKELAKIFCAHIWIFVGQL